MESFVSRESSFLFNNVFFLVICLAILCGTTFPIISEWVTGSKVTVSAPFFNKVVTPFAIGLMLLTGICPLIAWRRAGLKNLRRNFMMPVIFGLMVTVVLLLIGIRQWLPMLFFFSSAFVLATVYLEFSRGTQARMAMVREPAPVAFLRLVERNKRRYGGFIIHTGVAILFVGIAASSFFKIEKDVTLKPGTFFTAGDYTIHYRDLREMNDPHKQVVRAGMEIYKGDKSLGFVYPERHFYKNQDQPTTEVALLSLLKEDVYLILTGWDENATASFKIYINPLVGLIWRGGLIMALGGLIVLLPNFKTALATSSAREAIPGAQEAS